MPRPATILDAELLPHGNARWDAVMGGLLSILLLFMPAAFGAVEAWSSLIVLAGAGLLLLTFALRIAFDAEFRVAKTWLYLPVFALVALCILQAASLPTSVVRAVAPANVAIRDELLGNSIAFARASISLYPAATAACVRLLLIGVAVFLTVTSLVRNTRQLKIMLAAIFLIGCAEALVALAQIAAGTGSIYWLVPVTSGTTTAGTLVNYSNFSQFMNLSIGGGLALLLVRMAEQHRDGSFDPIGPGTLRRFWEQNGLLCAGLAICSLSILASLSRNGAIAMVAAATAVGLILLKRSTLSLRGWMLATIPAVVLVALFIYGFDLIYTRLATLHQADAYGMRWEMVQAAFRAWQRFPLWGTGFGTHEMVAPLFETTTTTVLAGHADNDYAQLLEETGVVGVAIVLAFLVGIAVVVTRLVLRGRKPLSLAAYGILYGLVAVAVQSATDFGQRIPANLALSAALCGLAVAVSRLEFRTPAVRPRLASSWRFDQKGVRVGAAALTLFAVSLTWCWVLPAAYAAYLGEQWWAAAVTFEARIQKNPEAAVEDDYLNLVAAAEGAARSVPESAQYGYWLNAYRWEALRHAAPADAIAAESVEALALVRRIADELANVRPLAPTFGPPYALEGQLRLFVLHEPTGAELIKKGVRLANYDPPTCLVAGELAAHEGRLAEAESLLARALQLQPGYFEEITTFCLDDLKNVQLAETLAGSDHRRLFALADAVRQADAFRGEAPQLFAAAEQALRAHAESNTAQADDLIRLARLDRERKNLSSAIELYRRALGQEYQRSDWRLELAQTLASAGRTAEAIHELKIVLRLRPRDPTATKLLEELVVRPDHGAQGDTSR